MGVSLGGYHANQEAGAALVGEHLAGREAGAWGPGWEGGGWVREGGEWVPGWEGGVCMSAWMGGGA